MGRSDSLLDDVFEMGLARPDLGLTLSAVTATGAAALHWIWPTLAGPLTFIFVIFLWVMAAVSVIASIAGFARRGVRRRRFERTKTLQDLRAMSWRQFEQVVADAYRFKGYHVIETGCTGDGGVDLLMRGPDGSLAAVQCKQWRHWRIGVPKIREFLGALADKPDVARGIYVTVGSYTEEAHALATRHHIKLIDGTSLLHLIGGRDAAATLRDAQLSRVRGGYGPACREKGRECRSRVLGMPYVSEVSRNRGCRGCSPNRVLRDLRILPLAR